MGSRSIPTILCRLQGCNCTCEFHDLCFQGLDISLQLLHVVFQQRQYGSSLRLNYTVLAAVRLRRIRNTFKRMPGNTCVAICAASSGSPPHGGVRLGKYVVPSPSSTMTARQMGKTVASSSLFCGCICNG